MSNLKDLKLKDVEVLNDLHLMASSSSNGDSMEGSIPEVTITGSGSGSGNSAATCQKCGTKYDAYGLCPKCDYESDPGAGTGSGYAMTPVSGSGKFKWYPVGDIYQIRKNACLGKSRGSVCRTDFGYNGAADGICVGMGDLVCEIPSKLLNCLGKNQDEPCEYYDENLNNRTGRCRQISKMAGSTTLRLHCSELK